MPASGWSGSSAPPWRRANSSSCTSRRSRCRTARSPASRRWCGGITRTRGILGADAFIPLAEETGLIVPVGEWVLRTACAQAIGWRDITLAVNISPAQFRKANIAATVRAALQGTGFPGHRLELEITEGLLIADTDATLGIVNELRRLTPPLSADLVDQFIRAFTPGARPTTGTERETGAVALARS